MNRTPRKRRPQQRRHLKATNSREFEWIEWIRRKEGADWRRAVVGIGDDAAAWSPRRGCTIVATVDTQVEGVHFRSAWLTAREIGARAVAASVSDLAAMGARPACLLISLVATHELTTPRFRALYNGLHEAAAACDCRIIGGNISQGSALSLSITALGECLPRKLLRRDGACPGDAIWVTGTPGLSRFGLRLIDADAPPPAGGSPTRSLRTRAVRAYKRPRPRVKEALTIASRWQPSAMVDISDGLFADLRHVLEASGQRRGGSLGATLDPGAIDELPALAALAAHYGETTSVALAQPSDDYELCFTTRREPTPRQRASFQSRFDLTVTRIGEIEAGGGIRMDGCDPIEGGGWQHL